MSDIAVAPAIATLPREAHPGRIALAAARPRQWTKNLLLFAGLVFAQRFDELPSWLAAAAAFAAFCAISSASYLVNDVRDAASDALHPVKRLRPVASGELAPRRALALACLCGIAGFAIALPLGLRTLLMLAAFACLQAAYSLGLKRIAIVDVTAIAGLFVLRAATGATAVGVGISPWLLACTALLALFLGLAKRRAELALVADGQTPGRAALRRYSLRVVDRLVVAVAITTLAVYCVYALAGPTPAMTATVPFVASGLARYVLLVRGRSLGEMPEEILLTDRGILASIAGFALTGGIVLVAT
jgi:decaprenyl-phosphate phosphoribosyltransferase